MSNDVRLLVSRHVERWRALCELSDVIGSFDFGFFTSFVRQTPDPETAVRSVLRQIKPESQALTNQWRRLVTDIWAIQHPDVPIVPNWALSSKEVVSTPLYIDVKEFLKAISEQPASLIKESNEVLLDPKEIPRLLMSLPSWTGKPISEVENEWSVIELRRLRAIVQSARLARVLHGKLVPVKSRTQRFLALPPAQQFYVLWHADVYHVDWGEFAGLWADYMKVIQEYLPVLWEAVSPLRANATEERLLWAVSVLEAYTPLWEEEGLLDVPSGQRAVLHIVQQHALPTIIDQFILRDLLERHGLATISEEFGSITKFKWTALGAKVIKAENTKNLPCGNGLLGSAQPHSH